MAAIPIPALNFRGKHSYIGFYHTTYTFTKNYPVTKARDQDNNVEYTVKVVYPTGNKVSHWLVLRLTATGKQKTDTVVPESGSLTWTYSTPAPPTPVLADPFTANTVALTDDDQA